jgi:hypothetical protein
MNRPSRGTPFLCIGTIGRLNQAIVDFAQIEGSAGFTQMGLAEGLDGVGADIENTVMLCAVEGRPGWLVTACRRPQDEAAGMERIDERIDQRSMGVDELGEAADGRRSATFVFSKDKGHDRQLPESRGAGIACKAGLNDGARQHLRGWPRPGRSLRRKGRGEAADSTDHL